MSDNDFALIEDDDDPELDLAHPWHVLVVDDEPDVHTATEYALMRFRHAHRPVQTTHALSGREAMAVIANKGIRFDMILMDVVMQTPTDGLDTAVAIREYLGCSDVPYITIRSGQPAMASEADVLRIPAINGYLSKAACSNEILKETLRVGLDHSAKFAAHCHCGYCRRNQ